MGEVASGHQGGEKWCRCAGRDRGEWRKREESGSGRGGRLGALALVMLVRRGLVAVQLQQRREPNRTRHFCPTKSHLAKKLRRL
eukprot:4946714-Pleurochrysis_carterae.AAC.1